MQSYMEQEIQSINTTQDDLKNKYTSKCRDIESIQNQLSELTCKSDEDIAYVYRAPEPNPWFTGRQAEFRKLESLLMKMKSAGQNKVSVAAVCGLGGCGKTSLVAEYAQRMKDHYQGGVFWFSAEDETKLETSVTDVALSIGIFLHDSFNVTLLKTLERISRIRNPWLIILDDMDELVITQNVRKIISGPWQQTAAGHLLITTRRKPSVLANDIRCFQESRCIHLECFDPQEAKDFLFSRTGILRDEGTDAVADDLVHRLGGLPLALEQAGAYIKCLNCCLYSYLESYKAKCLYLLNKQKASPTFVYESEERLAVQTTWLLNFEHIKENIEGEHAIRFLNACAFLNPDEIQQELMNAGKPLVDDEQFREFVSSPLASREILKMLTDFSLFKATQEGCLSVHRLVQEVVQENMRSHEKAQSIVDAVRMLRYAFSKCPTPDDLLSSIADQRQRGEFIDPTNPSLFYRWSKFCLHSHEISKSVEKFAKQSAKDAKTVSFPETARVVYDTALHLAVNGRHEEAKQKCIFACRVLDWASLPREDELSMEYLNTLFPHTFPLPELVRRHILYSCKSPVTFEKAGRKGTTVPSVSSESTEVEEIRLQGNRLFKDGLFAEAVEEYSRAIEMSKGSDVFDPRLLTNRASAYLRLERYENALTDAEEYILLCPDCWKGYARKALALNGLKDELNAKCFAALAFYRKKDVFVKYGPFKVEFKGVEEYISVCINSSDLVMAMTRKMVNEKSHRIILLPGDTSLAISVVGPVSVENCIMCGITKSVNSRALLKFKGNCILNLEGSCAVYNVDFQFDQGYGCTFSPSSFVGLFNCSFSSDNQTISAFQGCGRLEVDSCRFWNCRAGGFLIGRTGAAVVRNSVFSGNGMSGVEVREGGQLVIRNCDVFDNFQGVLVGPGASKCHLLGSRIHDNRVEGVVVNGKSIRVEMRDNRIFHNDDFGISVVDSAVIIERNVVFGNGLYGIWAERNSLCRISRNEVFRNKLGGIRVGKRDAKTANEVSVVEFNTIFENCGPGIIEMVSGFDVYGMEKGIFLPQEDCTELVEGLEKAKCEGNELRDNKELTEAEVSTLPLASRLCSLCGEEGDLKKCDKCFTTGYCGRDCQEQHWKTHRNMCPLFLEQFSVLVEFLPEYPGGKSKNDSLVMNTHRPGLEPIGPDYCKPPLQGGSRFIVKVQPGESYRIPVMLLYDRSTTFYGCFKSSHMWNMVRQDGTICQRKYLEKKIFLWALWCKNGELRVFTNEYPPYQRW